MDAMRLTRATDRSGAPSFTCPRSPWPPMARVISSGWAAQRTARICIRRGGAGRRRRRGRLHSPPFARARHEFFDPPQIATGPGEGEVWIATLIVWTRRIRA
jgi:hypothetical protein